VTTLSVSISLPRDTNEESAPGEIASSASRIHALAQQVIIDRLGRANVIGADKKGRTIIEYVGEPTPAELEWEQILLPPFYVIP
jgi:hypothetical protein